MKRTVREFRVKLGKEAELRQLLEGLNTQREIVDEILKQEGCTDHKIYLVLRADGIAMVVERLDTQEITTTLKQRRELTGNPIYDHLMRIMECVEIESLKQLPDTHQSEIDPITSFQNSISSRD